MAAVHVITAFKLNTNANQLNNLYNLIKNNSNFVRFGSLPNCPTTNNAPNEKPTILDAGVRELLKKDVTSLV